METLSTNLRKHSLLHTPTPKNTEGALKSGRPDESQGVIFFFTWLQPNYSRQLDWSLPLRTTLLAADLVPADNTTLKTYLMVPSHSPDLWN